VPLNIDYFDSSACGFPGPRVPLLPRLSTQTLANDAAGAVPSGFLGKPSRFFTRGRYALHAAMQAAGVGPKGALLAPAYHCRTMLDPAVALAAEVVLYPLREDLAPPHVDELHRLCDAAGERVRALLLTHYFGFPQEIGPIAAFCRAEGIVLIEDCSHAFFGESGAGTLGTFGDYAVASPYKFLPCSDGGVLVVNSAAALPPEPLARFGLLAETRAVIGNLLAAGKRRREQVSRNDIARIADDVRALTRTPFSTGGMYTRQETTPSAFYSIAEQGQAGHVASAWLIRLANVGNVGMLRGRNYRRWADATRNLPGCRALRPLLPDGCVPYMFPLLIDDPKFSFHALKKLGVPIWRWDEMAASGCAIP